MQDRINKITNVLDTNKAEAFAKDKDALQLCVEGAMEKKDKGLTSIQRVFFYMPLQHAESRKVQDKSCAIFNKLAEAVSPTYKETFETIAQFAELHSDIVQKVQKTALRAEHCHRS